MQKRIRKSTPIRRDAKRSEKSCQACMSTVPVSAKKCGHCGAYQDWRRHLQISQSVLALLVALISVLSMGIPIVKSTLTPDDSSVILTYLDRPDTTIPIIASNKGSRPAVMAAKAGLQFTTTNAAGTSRTHLLLLTPDNASRENLLLSENTSKQFFYVVDHKQPVEKAFENLAMDLDTLLSLTRCTFSISHISFRGQEQRTDLVIFDSERASQVSRSSDEETRYKRLMGALECLGKIPQPIRRQFALPGG